MFVIIKTGIISKMWIEIMKRCWKSRHLCVSCQMCHTRLEAVADILHHWEVFIVCLNCLPLNSPFIRFITSQRAGTLTQHSFSTAVKWHRQLHHTHPLMSMYTYCSIHGQYVGVCKHIVMEAISSFFTKVSLVSWGCPDHWPLCEVE